MYNKQIILFLFPHHLRRKLQTPTLECVSKTVQDTMAREAILTWITWLLEVLNIVFTQLDKH